MRMWYIILIVTILMTMAGFLYLGHQVGKFQIVQQLSYQGAKLKINSGYLIVLIAFCLLWWAFNLMNAVVCLFYFAIIWLACDLAFAVMAHFGGLQFQIYYAGVCAIILSSASLSWGWYQAHNIWQTEYTVYTDKDVAPLKIAFFADSHIGTTFNGAEFAGHIKKINENTPDAVFIVGDFIDDSTSKADMLAATKALSLLKTKFGVYFVLGNHDKGYYGAAYRGFSAAELVSELQKNNVTVLQDDVVALNSQFYLIGRKDAGHDKHGKHRLPMAELAKQVAPDKFSIVLDHQPNDYDSQQQAGVDLVLSGHTHGGQLWPLTRVGEWIKANDKTYGYEKRQNTNFIVTSGLSDWAIKFKTGTKSEFVIVNIERISQ